MKQTNAEGQSPGIVNYVPRSLFNRHDEIQRRAWEIRKESSQKSTKVWITKWEIELRIRNRESKIPWSMIKPEQLTGLPEQDPRGYQDERNEKSGLESDEETKKTRDKASTREPQNEEQISDERNVEMMN